MKETEQIDAYISGTMATDDRLVFEARLQIEPELREKLSWQLKTLELVREAGRNEIRNLIRETETIVFHTSAYRSFQKKIAAIFF